MHQMPAGYVRIRPLSQDKESFMEKPSTVQAVYAEGLVFESNFGMAESPATNSSNEGNERAQSIPAWSAAALTWENAGTSGTTAPTTH
jgi:hypothetical protein